MVKKRKKRKISMLKYILENVFKNEINFLSFEKNMKKIIIVEKRKKIQNFHVSNGICWMYSHHHINNVKLKIELILNKIWKYLKINKFKNQCHVAICNLIKLSWICLSTSTSCYHKRCGEFDKFFIWWINNVIPYTKSSFYDE